MKEKKQKSKTVQAYKKWVAGKYALYGAAFAAPTVPAGIVTLVNWQDWFKNSGASLPFGFASLILTVILAVLGVLKSDKIFKKADIALFALAGFFMCIGLTNLFLASLFSQCGFMWLYVGGGLIGSAVALVAEEKAVEPNIQMYRKLIDDNGLDAKAKRMKRREKLAKEEAEREAVE